MLQMEKEYRKEYGDIPSDSLGRFDYLLSHAKISKRTKVSVTEEIKRVIKIPWTKISYTIYLLPKATPRPRSGRNGIFYVKGAKDNRKFFEEYVRDQDIKLITTPTRFYCTAYFPIPNSMNNAEKILAELGLIYPISKPDFDNLVKAYCDMIQGYILEDDSLVTEGYVKKRYSIKPRIEISIEYMEDYDSAFNRNKILKKKGGKS